MKSFVYIYQTKCQQIEYTLSSCAGKIKTAGRKISGLVVESLDKNVTLNLPALIECSQVPDVRTEIATPYIAFYYPHLNDIAENIPPVDDNAHILWLIGRDVIEAHHVLDQRIGPRNSPYAKRLPLGWAIIGETCLGNIHQQETVNVNKTNLTGRPSVFQQCTNNVNTNENVLNSDTLRP